MNFWIGFYYCDTLRLEWRGEAPNEFAAMALALSTADLCSWSACGKGFNIHIKRE